jgi:hypothetical protein
MLTPDRGLDNEAIYASYLVIYQEMRRDVIGPGRIWSRLYADCIEALPDSELT